MSVFIAKGIYKTPFEAKGHMVRYSKEFTPNKEANKKYEILYKKVYKNIYPHLKGIYKELSDYQHEVVQK